MSQEPSKRNGLIGSIVDKLLGYADRPWRAIFVLLLVIIGGIGFAAYEEKAMIVRLLTGPHEAKLRSNLDGVITNLFWATTADAVSIWAVNFNAGLAKLVVGKYRSGDEWKIGPPLIPLLSSTANPERLGKLLRGESFCAEASTLISEAGQAVARDGFIWICVTPEPPSATEPIIGAIVIGWKSNVAVSSREIAIIAGQAETSNIIER